MRTGIVVVFALVWASVAFSAGAGTTRVELGPDLALEEVASGVWLHVSSKEVEGFGLVAANGLVIVSGGEAALLDTPWTDDHVRAIATWLDEHFEAKLTIAVPTHWHGDCLGGLAAAHGLGAASYASTSTIALAKKAGSTVPENGFDDQLDLSVGAFMIALVEAGRGHTVDNIVVWLPQREVLFGGCLVKSAGSKNLGYIEEADLDEWPHTIDRVAGRFPGAKVIVPGHGAPGGHELLVRTKELLDARKK